MTAEPINHRGKRRSAVLIAAGLAVVAAAVIASLYVFASGGPLDGDMTHDFGVVQMTFGHPVELRHTFRLSNRTSKPLVVHSVKPDCGCVTTAAANAVIEPGALLELPITLTLSTVKKRALIRLDLGEDGSQMLRVDAAGRFDPQLFASLEELVLRPGRATSFVLTAYVFDTYDPPARPAISPPPAVAASFGGWKLQARVKDPRTSPCIWEANVEVRMTSDALAAGQTLAAELEPAPAVTIKLRQASADEQEHDSAPPAPKIEILPG